MMGEWKEDGKGERARKNLERVGPENIWDGSDAS